MGICTYRRRLLLERTLDRVLPACSAWGAPVQLIVIDNDGQDPAVRAAVEARARETVDGGAPQTPFLQHGDTVRLEVSHLTPIRSTFYTN